MTSPQGESPIFTRDWNVPRPKAEGPDGGIPVKYLSRPGFAAVFAALLFSHVTPASAAVLTVTSAADSGAGSLRDAMAASAGGDTIQFAGALSGQTVHLQSSLLAFHSLTIDGSALATPITLSGDSDMDLDADVQILGAFPDTALTVDSVNFTRGTTNSFGGAIQSAGVVNLFNSTVSGSVAAVGGGVSAGTLVARGCTFTNNQASNSGGAIESQNATIVNSTITGNSAGAGGAIRIDFDQAARIVNTTISGNSAPFGGGILLQGTLSLENSIVANSGGGG